MNIVLGAAGAAVGFFATGGSITVAQIGWSIGSAVGSMFSASGQGSNSKTSGVQALMDLRIPGTDYGRAIPYARGSFRTAGDVWWNSDRRATTTTTSQTSSTSGGGGGKGGGGGTTSSQTEDSSVTTYDMDILIGLADQVIVGINRIWDDGKLIFTADAFAAQASLVASANAETWDRITVYTGAPGQLPDPTYEADVTTALAVAYRGRGSVFIEGLHLGVSGRVRNLNFEVVVDAVGGAVSTSLGIQDVLIGLTQQRYSTHNIVVAGKRGSGFAWAVHRSLAHVPDLLSLVLINMNTPEGTAIFDIPEEQFPPITGDFKIFGVDTDGSALIRTGGASTRLWRVNHNGDITFINITDPVARDVTSRGVVSSSSSADPFGIVNSTLWGSDATTKQVVLLSNCLFTSGGGTCLQEFTSGVNTIENQFAINAAGISGRVYGLGVNNVFWINTTTLVGTQVIASIATSSNVVVGDDGNLYTQQHVGSDTTVEKYSADGALLDSVVILGQLMEVSLYDANGFLWMSGFGADMDFVKIDPSTMTVVDTVSNPISANPLISSAYRDIVCEPIAGVPCVSRSNFGGLGLIRTFSTIEKLCPTVADVVSGVCLRCGLLASQFDVTLLASITRTVCSFTWSQITPGRQPLEMLMATYFFEMVMSGTKIKFVPRGGSSVVTIPYLELGATMNDEFVEPLPLIPVSDMEMPAQIALTYQNLFNDYQPDTQYSDRLVTATSQSVNEVTVTLGLVPTEAKQVTEVMLMDQHASNFSTKISLLGSYCYLEPTDPVTILDKDGSSFRFRLVKSLDSYPMIGFEAILDDVSVLSSQGITTADDTSQTIVAAAVGTLMKLLDIPILQDGDDDAGFYVATKGDGTPYPGSVVFDSPDDVTYTRKALIAESAIFGMCTSTLGDWTGPRVFDEMNTVTVDVGGATLSSTTRALILDDQATNAILIGNEMINFRTASFVSPGVYNLTGLLRGCRGTEWAMTGHTGAERAVVLRSAGLRRIVLPTNQIGFGRYYKAVTRGRDEGTAVSVLFTNTAVGKRPFAPVDARVSRNGSGDITLTWQRRSRLATTIIGPFGILIPLGEDTESYHVEFYSDSTFSTVVRTDGTPVTPTVSFTAAQQIAVGLTPFNPISFSIYQISATIGRSKPLSATL